MLDFIKAVLDDDHGINQDAYQALLKMCEHLNSKELEQIQNLLDRVDCTDSRFYLA